MMILLPLQTGHFWLAPNPDPPHSLHFISIFLMVSLTLTSLVIFPLPLQTGQVFLSPLTSPVPLQCLQISPLLKLQTIYPPVQNFSKGIHISVLKSPPFLNGFFSSSLSPASPCRSQVILLATSISTSQALLISTYFFCISSLPAFLSGWYLMDSLLKAFFNSSLVAFSSTSKSSQRQVSLWQATIQAKLSSRIRITPLVIKFAYFKNITRHQQHLSRLEQKELFLQQNRLLQLSKQFERRTQNMPSLGSTSQIEFQMQVGKLIPEEEHFNISPRRLNHQDQTQGRIHSQGTIKNRSFLIVKVLFALLLVGLLIYAWMVGSKFVTQVKENMLMKQNTDEIVDRIVEMKLRENANILKYEEMVRDIKAERQKNEKNLAKIVQLQQWLKSKDLSLQSEEQRFILKTTDEEMSSGNLDSSAISRQIKYLKKSLTQIEQKQKALFKLVSYVNSEVDKHAANEQKYIDKFIDIAHRSEYMTPELFAISQMRVQKGGILKTPNGTVSQIDFEKVNAIGQRIQHVLYRTDEERKERMNYHMHRRNTLNSIKTDSLRNIFSLVNYNINFDGISKSQMKIDLQWSYQNDRIAHSFDTIDTELPICIIAPGYNNNKNTRIQYNLNSLFSQNYTNYFIVIINDASTDGSDEVFRKYLSFNSISKEKYVYIENKQRKTALENIYNSCHQYCSEDSIVAIVDGDDELVGRNVFKSFNSGYQRRKSGVLYSNFFWYNHFEDRVMLGFTEQYTDQIKESNIYRISEQKFSQLRSFRNRLFRNINETDLKDEDGGFFTIAYDMAIFFPMMEMSCGRVNKIEGYHYLYNMGTGLNDYYLDGSRQIKVDKKIRARNMYSCDKDFEADMTK